MLEIGGVLCTFMKELKKKKEPQINCADGSEVKRRGIHKTRARENADDKSYNKGVACYVVVRARGGKLGENAKINK